MSYQSLILHVEPSDVGRERLRTAIAITQLFRARLIGVGARAYNPIPDPVGLSSVKLKQEIEEDLVKAELLFKEEVAALADIQCVWRSGTDFPTRALLSYACEVDLIITGRNVEADADETEAGTADLIMASGLPVLAVPDLAKFDCERIVVAWKNTRETRRAIWDALPFLKHAEHVRLVQVNSEPAPELLGVTERLRLHGVRVEAELRKGVEDSVAQDLLAAAEVIGAGLIVAGGYGHSRVREWALGGVTQELLEASPKPVLFSH